MIRMPLATASLLAIAISLAGCGEGKDKAAAPQAPTLAASTTAPAAATPAGQVDATAAKRLSRHYADMVFAVYSDAESTAKTCRPRSTPSSPIRTTQTLKAARAAWGRRTRTVPAERSVPLRQYHHRRLGSQANAWPLDEGLIDYTGQLTNTPWATQAPTPTSLPIPIQVGEVQGRREGHHPGKTRQPQ